MPISFHDVSRRFEARRFSWNCEECRAFVQQILQVPAAERIANSEEFYDSVEAIMDDLYSHYCGGTLVHAEKSALFQIIRDDWSDDAPGSLRASMVIVLNMLQPLEGIAEWFIEAADRQTDSEYAEYLRSCATRERTTPVV